MIDKRGLLRRVTVRLTIMYLALFVTASLVIFMLIYFSLASALRGRVDKALQDEEVEFESLYIKHGLQRLQKEFVNEARSNGCGTWFYLLLSPDHRILASSDLTPWQRINLKPKFLDTLREGDALLKTWPRPGSEHKIRVLYKGLSGGNILEVGQSLRDNDEILEDVAQVFIYGFLAMLLVGTLLGWLISRRAMAGVERVTDIAAHIDGSDLSRRVPPGREGLEIEELARAFNGMLDRIQALINDLENVTNNIAHDLRSPLTRVRGMAEAVLYSQPDPSEFRETAGMIIEECDQLLGIINTMLLIAQTDSGLSPLSKEPLDLRETVRDVAELFRPAAEDKGIYYPAGYPP